MDIARTNGINQLDYLIKQLLNSVLLSDSFNFKLCKMHIISKYKTLT